MSDTSFGLAGNKVTRLPTMYSAPGIQQGMDFSPELPSDIVPYERAGNNNYLKHADYPMGGSGLVSMAEDYFRFAQMLRMAGNSMVNKYRVPRRSNS